MIRAVRGHGLRDFFLSFGAETHTFLDILGKLEKALRKTRYRAFLKFKVCLNFRESHAASAVFFKKSVRLELASRALSAHRDLSAERCVCHFSSKKKRQKDTTLSLRYICVLKARGTASLYATRAPLARSFRAAHSPGPRRPRAARKFSKDTKPFWREDSLRSLKEALLPKALRN